MLRTIIRREILETINSPKFLFTFLLCMILIMLSIYIGIGTYREEVKEYNAAIALNRKNLESQTSYSGVAGYGTKITKPPQVLSTIISGIQSAVGRQATVNTVLDPNLVDSRYDSNPVLAIFGELDLTLIVKVVLSLLALLFTYDAVTGEKENGTLKLSLANRVPRDKLLLGKAIGGFVSLLVPLVIPFLTGLIMLLMYPDISFSGEDWLRVGILFSLFLVYLSVFFMLGIFVSTLAKRSSSSLFILLFIWVTFIFVIPKVAVIAAGRFRPIPSVHEITAQKDAFMQEVQGSFQKEMGEWIKKNSGGNPDFQEEFKTYIEEKQQSNNASIEENNARLDQEYQSLRTAQQELAFAMSRLSPASSLTFGAMSLGRTGLQEHERFSNSVKRYKSIFSKWATAKMMQSLDFSNPLEQVKPDISDMPRHEYNAQNLRNSIMQALPDFTVMILMIIVFFSGAFVAFLRYDVR